MSSEEIVDLTQRNDYRDTRGKSGDDRRGEIAYQLADPAYSRNNEYRAGEKSRSQHAGYAELSRNGQQYRRHSAGRSGDLVGRTGQHADNYTRYDSRHKS